jgi:hypothetical protein
MGLGIELRWLAGFPVSRNVNGGMNENNAAISPNIHPAKGFIAAGLLGIRFPEKY